jgi:uncharacterized protein YdeI (YjbR/CyaY-like superfamily)
LPDATEPIFFATPDQFRAWLEEHHDSAREVLVGYYKASSSRPSITWPQSVDEALCFGWIDGVRKRIDDERYMIRFTPRKPGGNWSAVNVERIKELTELGLMRPAGLNAFEERAEAKTAVYAYEQRDAAVLDDAEDRELRANPQAWEFFQARPPSYRKAAIWWVVSAKKPETRRKRLATLIDDSANGRTVKPLTRPGQG